MELKDLFYKWVPVYIKLPVLFILFFVILTANGVFLGNSTDMYSSLGVCAEPYTAAYNAMYIGMGLGLMVALRFKLRFSNKTLLLAGLSIMLGMNIVCATTDDPVVVIAACLILGFCKVAALVEVYIIWLYVWKESTRMYPFVYFTALSGLYFITWLTTKLAYTYNWRYAYICIIILLLICLLLTLIFAENHPLKKALPLYQMDWTGLVLLLSSMLLLNYVVVYGKVEDWLASDNIKAALFGALILLLFFIRRELMIKHPLINLRFFKKVNFCVGLFYFFLMGIFFPSTLQSAFAGSILHFENIRNTELNLYLIPGVLAGSILCYIWYSKKYNDTLLICIGFLSFVAYHYLMYISFVSGFGIDDFWLPSVVKGFAIALIYIAVGLYTNKGFEMREVMTAAGIMIIARSFLGSGIFTSAYAYFLYVLRIRHFSYLAGMTDTTERSDLYRVLQEQSILTASKEMSGYIIIAGIVLSAAILLSYVSQKVKSRI